MSLDDATANDAMLVDDDLVASLGFEPTTTVEPVAGDVLDVRTGLAEIVATDDEAVEVIDLDAAPEADVDDFDEPTDDGEGEILADDTLVDHDHDHDDDEDDLDDLEAQELEVAELISEERVDPDILSDEDDPLFGSINTPLVASLDDLEAAVDASDDLQADEIDDDIELFDVAHDDDLGDDVIDLVTDDLDVPEDLDLSGRSPAETEGVAAVAADAMIISAPDDAELLAEFDDVFAPTSNPAVSEAVTATVPAVGAATAITSAGKRRGKLRARKVRRVIRHVDPWSVLTFSVLFHLVFFSSMLLASILVWNGAVQAGTIDNIENFIRELGDYETFNINSDVVFRAAVVIAGMLTLASSIIVVLLTVVFNLVSDLVGGIRVTVIEEDTVVVPSGE